MAQPLKPKDGPTKGHNVATVNAAIITWTKARLKKEAEIKKAHELYIKGLKQDLSRLDKNIKTDSGLTLRVLKANYNLVKIQEDAKEFLDEDAANDLLDGMRVSFEAMHSGQQFDFIDAIEASDKPKPDLKAVT